MADQEDKRFYCHKCSRQVQPTLPEFLCPHCDNGFIEELEDERNEDDLQNIQPSEEMRGEMNDFANVLFGLMNPSTQQHPPRGRGHSVGGNAGRGIFIATNSGGNQSQAPGAYQVGTMEHLLSSLLTGLAGPWMAQGPMEIPMTFLHGNAADYAWGQGGLDDVITRLLNQFEGAGPPPVPRERISEIKDFKITQRNKDENIQCPVCMSDFEVDEVVKKLPQCSHMFHNDCIIPWLELHDSCPVCRKPMLSENASSPTYFSSDSPGSSSNRPSPPSHPPPRRDLDYLDDYD